MKLTEIARPKAVPKQGLKIRVVYADYPSITSSEQAMVKRAIRRAAKAYPGTKITNPEFGTFEVFIPNVTKEIGDKFAEAFDFQIAFETDDPLNWDIEYEEVSE